MTAEQIAALAAWDPHAEGGTEIQFTPARVLLQDFTGVPCVVDLVAMRDAMADLGGDPRRINPLIPAELVIDHSVIADVFGRADAFRRNAELEFDRNQERYQLLRWAQQSFDDFRVVPPDTGICHQVNLEYLSRVVFTTDGPRGATAYPGHPGRHRLAHPDGQRAGRAGLGRRRHRGRGGHARPADEHAHSPGRRGSSSPATCRRAPPPPIWSSPWPSSCAGSGWSASSSTSTARAWPTCPLANRATLGNMSPEYGSTCAIFPIDAETLTYLRLTGRPEQQVRLVEAYAKEQGLWGRRGHVAGHSQRIERTWHGGTVDRRAEVSPGSDRAGRRPHTFRCPSRSVECLTGPMVRVVRRCLGSVSIRVSRPYLGSARVDFPVMTYLHRCSGDDRAPCCVQGLRCTCIRRASTTRGCG